MSKTIKRKITVELPKPVDLSKNRLSVFQRLGTKKLKPQEPTPVDYAKHPQTLSKITEKPEPIVRELEDADPDLLERKRAEIQKELELQLKMEASRKSTKEIVRKRKKIQSSSSSSSSSSDSSSSDSSSSSSSKESKRKIKKTKTKQRRNSSSSSDEPRPKKAKVKRVCHKKIEGVKIYKSGHVSKKSLTQQGIGKGRKRTESPTARKKIPVSPSRISHKSQLKTKLSSADVGMSSLKHHRLKDVSGREKEREMHHPRERERERVRSKDRERDRSRTPKFRHKSRTPKGISRSRDVGRSPQRRGSPSKPRISGTGIRRDRSPERQGGKKDVKGLDRSRERDRERREKERQDREAAREKERAEILARCQERQRERERLAREKARRERERTEERGKSDRLLPRPAERALALAAAHDRSRDKSLDRDRPRSHSHGRMARDRLDREKERLGFDRAYEREDVRYEHHDRHFEKDDRIMVDEHDRNYMMIRRREESRGHSPYAMRDKRLDREELERELYIGGTDQRYDEHLREDRRDNLDYPGRVYVDDRHRFEREREWIRENEIIQEQERRMMYDHPQERISAREWDRPDIAPGHVGPIQDNYIDNREWSNMNEHQWESGPGQWQQEEEIENWDNCEEKEWQDYHRINDKIRHDNIGGNVGAPLGGVPPVVNSGGVGVGGSGGGGGGGGGGVGGGNNPSVRRWPNWRGRRGNQHHGGGGIGDYRRHNMYGQNEGYQNRGEGNFNRRNMHLQKTVEPQQTATVATVPSLDVAAPRHQVPIVPKVEPVTTPVKPIINTPVVATPNQLPTPTPVAAVAIATVIATPTAVTTEEKPIAQNEVQQPTEEAEENIPDDLSEISGDDADDILNRQEDELLTSSPSFQLKQNVNCNENYDRNDGYGEDQCCTSANQSELQEKISAEIPSQPSEETETQTAPKEQQQQPQQQSVEESIVETTEPTVAKVDSQESKDIPDELDLDFEEISDGELEEEARIRGLGDALGVDWASLVEESKAIAKEKSNIIKTTAKQRWQPHRILLDVGISLKMCKNGSKYLNDAYAKLQSEKLEEVKTNIKIEPQDREYDIKEEALPDSGLMMEEPLKKFVKLESDQNDFAYHPIACVQVAHRLEKEKRQNLIFNATGSYSRALSMRQDFLMRRQLFGLTSVESDCKSSKSNLKSGYAKIALNLFRKTLEEVH